MDQGSAFPLAVVIILYVRCQCCVVFDNTLMDSVWTNEESERAIESSITAECWTDSLEGCWQHWSGIKQNHFRSSLIVFDGLTEKDDIQGFRAVNGKDLQIAHYPN